MFHDRAAYDWRRLSGAFHIGHITARSRLNRGIRGPGIIGAENLGRNKAQQIRHFSEVPCWGLPERDMPMRRFWRLDRVGFAILRRHDSGV
jgi:hypothetical protein